MQFKIREDEDGDRIGAYTVISKDELEDMGFEGTPVTEDDETIGIVRNAEMREDGTVRATIELTDHEE